MKKNKKLYMVAGKVAMGALAALFCLSSCKKSDWYDIKSNKSLVIPSSLNDLQALLDNPVMNWLYPALGEVACDDHYVSATNAASLTPVELNAYTWSHDQPYFNVQDWQRSDQSGAYGRIYYANLVLDGLKNLSPGAQYNLVKGEALFIRAQSFFDMAQLYAPPYNASTAATDLSIPLRLESDVNIPSKRSTVEQTYTQVINDLKEAETLLPDVPAYKTRGSKPAADAVLARVYLSMGNYAQALNYASAALQYNSKLLDYNAFKSTTSPVFPIYGQEVIFHSTMVGYGAITSALIDTALYNSYADNDLRKTLFFKINADKTISIGGTYFYNSPFSGLTIDELYITRAECYARTGKLTEAMADLNNLLRTRWKTGTYTDMTAASADEALGKILIERRKELIDRGQRWVDLRRLNKEDRFKTTLTHIINGKTYTLQPNTFKYTFPIPDDVIQISGIQQNPGW